MDIYSHIETNPIARPMPAFWQSLDTEGFAIVDRYLNPTTIAVLIHDLEALDLTPDRAGIRNILELLPSVENLARSPEIRSLVEPILGTTARIVRSIFFDKQPTANWKVPWHQDVTIAVKNRWELPDYHPWSLKGGIPHVQPPTAILERMLTVRIHLDRTDAANGALKVIPGSHRQGKLSAVEIDRHKQLDTSTICTCEPGGILLMRPLLLHASSIATVPTHRRVIHLEYANCSLPAGLEWYYDDFDNSSC
jgi:ectoine hydroxylase-related dioxygenase (phytanoyl-CoA dioxygenase family)